MLPRDNSDDFVESCVLCDRRNDLKCVHVEQLSNNHFVMRMLRHRNLTTPDLTCDICSEKNAEANFWMCLTCGSINCAKDDKNHVKEHWKIAEHNRCGCVHCLALDTTNWTVFCYQCNRQVDLENESNLKNKVNSYYHYLTSDLSKQPNNDFKCPHVNKGHNYLQLNKVLRYKPGDKPNFQCVTCQKMDENSNGVENEKNTEVSLWMCLNCSSFNCGKDGQDHAKDHSKGPHSDCHCLALDTTNFTVWCYECDRQVDLINEDDLDNLVNGYYYQVITRLSKERLKCTHVEKGHNYRHLNKVLSHKTNVQCAICQKMDENSNGVENENNAEATLWMCLNCSSFHCGKDGQDHAKDHSKGPHSDCHCLALDTTNWTVWCYECNRQVDLRTEGLLNNKVNGWYHQVITRLFENSRNAFKCVHVKKGHNYSYLKKALKNKTNLRCTICQKMDENSNGAVNEKNAEVWLWMCLSCSSFNCGKIIQDDKDHAKEHSKGPYSDCHSLALNTTILNVWCYECNREVDLDNERHLKNKVDTFYRQALSSLPKQMASYKSPVLCQKVTSVKHVEEKLKVPFPKVSGLNNLGNTCFFNAVLQCLAQTPFLVQVLDDLKTLDVDFVLPGGKCKIGIDKEEEEIELPPIEGSIEKLGYNTITSVLCQTLTNMQKNSQSTIRPDELLSAIRKKSINCMDGGQHDSHELLRHLLELVRTEDLKRYYRVILDTHNLTKGSNNHENVDKDSKTRIKFYGQQASSRLLGPESVFQGILVSTLECSECHNTSSRTEPFLDLSLPVMVAKKEQNSFDDEPPTTMIVNNIPNSNSTSTMSRKKQAQLAKKEKKEKRKAAKRNAKMKHASSYDDNLPNDNSISEKNSVCDEESDADIEDNIETEGVNAPEVIESGYSSEKASAVASPVSLNEHPVPGMSSELNGGLTMNLDLTMNPLCYFCCHQTPESELVSQLANDNEEKHQAVNSSPSPIDVSMADLSQEKVIGSASTYGNNFKNYLQSDTLGDYLQNTLTINSETLTSSEGQTVSPASSSIRSKDSPTSPISSGSVGDESDPPVLKLCQELKQENSKLWKANEKEYEAAQNDEEKSSLVESSDFKNANDNDLSNANSKYKTANSVSPKTRYLTTEGECSVMSCLNQFTALELMTGSNKVGCDACTARENKGKEGKKVYTTSTKQYLIMQVPPVLILHLKRFQMQRRGFNKLNKHVEFPLLLDLAPVCKGITKPKIYALYGVVVHLGTCSGGHYVSYVKSRMPLTADDPRWSFVKKMTNSETEESEEKSPLEDCLADEKSLQNVEPPPGRWYYVSDSSVSEVSESTVLQSQAYLLFYERIQ